MQVIASLLLSLATAQVDADVPSGNPARTATATDPAAAWLAGHADALLVFYRELHANPELSLEEHATATTMATVLESVGFEVTPGIGGTGVVGVLRNGEGPTVLVRCDMDALPIVERTGLPYASTKSVEREDGGQVGVMHACGHDVHMSVWAGTASALAAARESWSGTLVFVAQPAEELGMGAKAMLEDGLYERFPKPDYALALHAKAEIAAGKVGTVSGWALANVDTVDILVRGEGGHGSAPHRTKDPIALAARIVMGLQTIVSREVAPLQPAVVTVGSIHGGTKHNIIPNEVKMQLTVRSYDPGVRQQLLDAIVRTAEHEARAAGFPEGILPVVEISDTQETPATWNTPELVVRVDAAIERALGSGTIVEAGQVMGAEDFGRYGPAAGCPSYLFWLGTSNPAEIAAAEAGAGPWPPSVHTDRYGAPDPVPVLDTGVRAMTAAVLELLPVTD
jgi:hippurate hydrolase